MRDLSERRILTSMLDFLRADAREADLHKRNITSIRTSLAGLFAVTADCTAIPNTLSGKSLQDLFKSKQHLALGFIEFLRSLYLGKRQAGLSEEYIYDLDDVQEKLACVFGVNPDSHGAIAEALEGRSLMERYGVAASVRKDEHAAPAYEEVLGGRQPTPPQPEERRPACTTCNIMHRKCEMGSSGSVCTICERLGTPCSWRAVQRGRPRLLRRDDSRHANSAPGSYESPSNEVANVDPKRERSLPRSFGPGTELSTERDAATQMPPTPGESVRQASNGLAIQSPGHSLPGQHTLDVRLRRNSRSNAPLGGD